MGIKGADLKNAEPKPDFYGRYIDDCIGAISSSREELNRFITSVNSFHQALKYTWEISETSLAFLDIKVPINGNGLRTSVHYKPTDSHSYLLHSSSHPSHVKNSIPYSQFLRLRRLCSDDSDFSNKSQEMCQFFEKRGYPASVIQTAHHRAQQTDQEHLRDVEKNDKDASKPVARHFNLPNHFKEHMSICGLSLHQGTTDSRKNLEQRFIFQIGTLNPHSINERFSFN